jgi:hypothetical protein
MHILGFWLWHCLCITWLDSYLDCFWEDPEVQEHKSIGVSNNRDGKTMNLTLLQCIQKISISIGSLFNNNLEHLDMTYSALLAQELFYWVASATYVPSMTPVTFLGESVLPPVKSNTFKMLLKYLWVTNISTDSCVAPLMEQLFVLF